MRQKIWTRENHVKCLEHVREHNHQTFKLKKKIMTK